MSLFLANMIAVSRRLRPTRKKCLSAMFVVVFATGAGGLVGAHAETPPADGSQGAPAALARYPNLLEKYAKRPPWNVAGVDYGVGPPSGQSFEDWRNVSIRGCTPAVAKNMMICSGKDITVVGVDFSTAGGAQLFINGSTGTATIKNNRWGGATLPFLATGVIDVDAPAVVVENNDLNGASLGPAPQTQAALVLLRTGVRHAVVQYNYLHNYPGQVVNPVGGDGAALELYYRYNLIDDCNPSRDDHMNVLQWISGDVSVEFSFNTLRQTLLGGAEGPQGYFNRSGTFRRILFNNNTEIALKHGGTWTMSYIDHGSVTAAGGTLLTGPAEVKDNYFDVTGAEGGAFYPGTWKGWTLSGNINMSTGRNLPNNP
jgi:hypothetical protein